MIINNHHDFTKPLNITIDNHLNWISCWLNYYLYINNKVFPVLNFMFCINPNISMNFYYYVITSKHISVQNVILRVPFQRDSNPNHQCIYHLTLALKEIRNREMTRLTVKGKSFMYSPVYLKKLSRDFIFTQQDNPLASSWFRCYVWSSKNSEI